MLDGPAFVRVLRDCGVSHVIWIPDSTLGQWDGALSAADGIDVVRVCREGEAFAVAAGLLIGGRRPLVVIQCTGLFEAGDSLRNFVHDMGLPLFMLVGLRNYYAAREGRSRDTAASFAQPILEAWRIPYRLIEREHGAAELAAAIREARAENRAGAALLAE